VRGYAVSHGELVALSQCLPAYSFCANIITANHTLGGGVAAVHHLVRALLGAANSPHKVVNRRRRFMSRTAM
jgi:hypothetical protein